MMMMIYRVMLNIKQTKIGDLNFYCTLGLPSWGNSSKNIKKNCSYFFIYIVLMMTLQYFDLVQQDNKSLFRKLFVLAM